MDDLLITIFTNAPPEYDLPCVTIVAEIPRCRMIDCPRDYLYDQLSLAHNGMFWATTDIEEAGMMRARYPYIAKDFT